MIGLIDDELSVRDGIVECEGKEEEGKRELEVAEDDEGGGVI